MLKILSIINKKLISLYVIIAFFILWEVAPRIGLADPQFMPPLSHVLASAKQVTILAIILDTAVSLKRIIIGFTLSTVLAVPIGFLLGGAFPWLAKFFKPLLNFLSQIPAFILFPVFVIIFFKVIIPAALESIIIGMKTGMSMAFMMLIGAESLGADSGLGWLIHNAQSMGFVPRIYLAVILVAVLGLVVNYVFQWIEESIIIWK